ncbi:hypothetical protein Catovirus_1_321 [Catovirus CTV1]|uniref:Uncharacterized protein n=1 Tax=Catovirus CTV1 TaxID=1977631 RepID=A0A1V0S9A7_9VIRU|nr:hypothetical protein Catovirus_1_321 [Catovirus CTV1]
MTDQYIPKRIIKLLFEEFEKGVTVDQMINKYSEVDLSNYVLVECEQYKCLINKHTYEKLGKRSGKLSELNMDADDLEFNKSLPVIENFYMKNNFGDELLLNSITNYINNTIEYDDFTDSEDYDSVCTE